MLERVIRQIRETIGARAGVPAIALAPVAARSRRVFVANAPSRRVVIATARSRRIIATACAGRVVAGLLAFIE
ncbi:MAG TPA: hypothetical protein VGB61_02515 [Pyrinomonadaceae bacterium]